MRRAGKLTVVWGISGGKHGFVQSGSRLRLRYWAILLMAAATALALSSTVPVQASTSQKRISYGAFFAQQPNPSLSEGSRLFLPGQSQVFVSKHPGLIELTFQDRQQRLASVYLFPPKGKSRIQPGSYLMRPETVDPHFEVLALGGGCVADSSVTVHDVGYTTQNVLTRLNLTFVSYCGDETTAIYGQVVYNEPAPAGLTFVPSTLAFAPTFSGMTSTAPVALVNLSNRPVRLARATLTSTGPIAITNDSCSNHTLNAKSACLLTATYHPAAAGTTQTTLQVTSATGIRSAAALSGTAIGGPTFLAVAVHASGEPDAHYTFTPQNARMTYENRLWMLWVAAEIPGSGWSLNMTAPAGLHVGWFTGMPPYNSGAINVPTFSISGDGIGCSSGTSTVQITEFAINTTPLPTHLVLNFKQQCTIDGKSLVFTGTAAFNA